MHFKIGWAQQPLIEASSCYTKKKRKLYWALSRRFFHLISASPRQSGPSRGSLLGTRTVSLREAVQANRKQLSTLAVTTADVNWLSSPLLMIKALTRQLGGNTKYKMFHLALIIHAHCDKQHMSATLHYDVVTNQLRYPFHKSSLAGEESVKGLNQKN